MTSCWVGVASRDHVHTAVSEGFCQLSHGREAPLRRLIPGDKIVYYSSKDHMQGGVLLQSFTAIGEVLDRDIYAVAVSDNFRPYRRDVKYFDAVEATIRPLLLKLSFAGNNPNWGLVLRRGLFQIQVADYHVIAQAMRIYARE